MSEEADDMPRDNGIDHTSESGVHRLRIAEELEPVRKPARRRRNVLTDLDRFWKVAILVGAIGASAVAGYKMLAGKADASVLPRVDALEGDFQHLHEDVVGMRQDIRAFAVGRPLPVLTPDHFADPTPHPTPEGTVTP